MRKGVVIILLALAGVKDVSAILLGSISLETNLLTCTTYGNVVSNTTLVISNSGLGSFTFATSFAYDESGESGWASVIPTGGTLVAGAALTLTNIATVASGHPSAPGTYYATCTVASASADNSPQRYTIQLIAQGCDIFPTGGPLAGGNVVTITNTYRSIGDGSDITNVVVGTVDTANIIGQGTNWVSFVAPATGSVGVKDIVIQSASVGATTLSGVYTVNPAGFIFDNQQRGWLNTYTMPVPLDSMGVAMWNGAIYAVCGNSTNGLSNVTLRFDGTNWVTLNSAPMSVTDPGVFVLGGFLYVAGGQDSGGWATNRVGRFDGTNWSAAASLPSARRNHATAVLNGFAYAIGGVDGGANTMDTVYKFDGTNWTTTTALPQAMYCLRAATLGKYIYVFGGLNGTGGQITTVYKFDGATWTTAGTMPAWRYYPGVCTSSNFIYMACGGNTSYTPTTNLFRFNGTNWFEDDGMSSARIGCGVGEAGSRIWIFGGRYGGADASVYKFSEGSTGVTPTSGLADGGFTVTIMGRYLGSGTDITNVTLCGVPVASIDSQNATQVLVTAAATVGYKFGDVCVFSTTQGSTVKSNIFTYNSAILGVYSVNSDYIGNGDAPNALYGTDFGAIAEGATVSNEYYISEDSYQLPLNITNVHITGPGADAFSVTGIPSALLASEYTNFFVRFAPTEPGTYTAAVEVETDVATNAYVVNIVGSAYRLSSSNGPFAGGNTITITNGHLGAITNVLVGGIKAAIQNSGANWVTITIPATGSAGVKDIVIQTSDNGDITLAGAYTVHPAGEMVSVDPVSGSYTGGYSVTISGSNLGDGGDITNVILCGVSTTNFVSQSATQVVFVAGAGGPGQGDVRVYSTSYGMTVKSNAFTYNAPGLQALGIDGAVIESGSGVSLEKGNFFGYTTVGASLIHTFSLTNNGTDALTIGGWSTNGDASSFTVSDLPSVIPPSSVVQFNVTFTPPALGGFSASLAISNNSPTASYILNLAGSAFAVSTNVGPYAGGNTVTITTGVPAHNGVFGYGASSVFPTQSYNAANYWVDVVFQTEVPPTRTSIWSNSVTPALVDGGPDAAVELGVKFRSDVAGTITGIRFYKSSANTGIHVGSLWSSAGSCLATVIFSNETESGWQEALFATPVAILSNTVYVASYHTDSGHYSADLNYFLADLDYPPLHALSGSAAGSEDITNVTVGGVAAMMMGQGINWVTITIPATGSAGVKDIVLQTVSGDRTLAAAYTINPAGEITTVSPSSGSWTGDYQVVITGTNLCDGGDITNVILCGISTTNFVSQSATQVVFVAGAAGLGQGDVRIYSVSFGETVKSNAFVYLKENQTITFPNPDSQVTTNRVGLTATASSGLAVDFAVDSGPASITEGTNLTCSGAGTVSIVASQAGDTYFNPAPSITNAFLVTKALASVTLTNLNQTYDGTTRGVGFESIPFGLSVLLTYDGDTNVPVNAGSYAVTGTVDDVMYQGVVTGTLVVAKADQTIHFAPISDQLTTNQVGLAATADSGLAVSFTTNGGPAVITDGTNLSFTGTGEVSLVASQSGDGNWNAAPEVTNTFNVTKATASVTQTNLTQTYDGTARVVGFESVPSGLSVLFTYDGNPWAPTNVGTYTVTGTVDDVMYQGVATGTLEVTKGTAGVYLGSLTQIYDGNAKSMTATTMPSGLTVEFTYDGNAWAPTNVGTYAVTGTVNDANWQGEAVGTLTISKADQGITFDGINDQETTNWLGLTATATSGLEVSFSVLSGSATITDGTNLSFTGAGGVSLIASQSGDDNWNAAPDVTNTFNVTKALAGVTLTNLTQTYDGTTRGVGFESVPSGLSVLFTYDGDTNAPVNAGSYAVTGTVDDVMYQGVVTGTLVVAKADQTIHFAPISDQLTTNQVGLAATADSGLIVAFTTNGGPAVITDGTNLSFTGAGEVSLVASQSGDGNWNVAPDVTNTFNVTKALAGVTLTNLTQTYDGTTRGVGFESVPSGLSVLFTYDGDTNAPVNAGSYAVTGTVDDVMYQGVVTGTLVVAKADQTIHFAPISDQLTTNQVGLAATADSGLAVSFTTNGGPAVITDGTNLSFTGAGEVSLVASQSGDGNWNAASEVTNTFNLTKALAGVTLTNLTQTYDGTARVVGFESVPSGLSVLLTYDGDTNAPVNAGSYAVTGAVVETMWQGIQTGALVVAKGNAEVFLGDLNPIYDGTAKAASVTTTPSGLTVDFTYDGSGSAPVNAGTYVVTGIVNDANWQGEASADLTIAKADQTITFPSIPEQHQTNTYGLAATTGSGLPVSFSVLSGPASLNDGTNLNFTGVGDVSIVASQGGDTNWNAAANVTNTFEVYAVVWVSQPVTNGVYDAAYRYDLYAYERQSGRPVAYSGANLPAWLSVTNLDLITTVAGTGTDGYSGDDAPATNAMLNFALHVAVGPDNTWVIADTVNNRIRKVDANGMITTVAGNGSFGYSGDGAAATNAMLGLPEGVAMDEAGNVYLTDTENQRIRKIDPTGIITTIAGTGTAGDMGDGGTATNAQLNFPKAVAVDSVGNVYVADSENNRIRKVATNGVITTVAGNGTYAYGGDGGPATNASLQAPSGVAVDPVGNVFIADRYNNRIRKVDAAGIVTTVAGNGNLGYSGDGGVATNATLNYPCAVAVDWVGRIYISDTENTRIRRVDTNGMINVLAGNGNFGYSGDGGPALDARLDSPNGVAVDSCGRVYVADYYNMRIRQISPTAAILSGTPTAAGAYDITLWASDGNSSNAQNFRLVIDKALATVTLGDLEQTYDGNPHEVSATSVPAGLSVLFTYDGDTNAPVNAGSYAVTGTVDDVLYQGVETGTLTVAKAEQAISFGAISDQLTTNQVGLAATADSGLVVTFTTNGGPAVITDSTNLSFTGAGEVSIVASQSGDSNWNAAPDVTNTFNVTKATASVTLTNLTQTYDGTARGVGFESVPSGLSVLLTYDGNPWAPTNVGTYTVTGTVDDVMYQGVATGTLEVTKGTAGVYLGSLTQIYDGNAQSVTATTMPSGLTVEFTYDGNAWAPTNVGTYAVTGTVNDANWQGEAVGTLTISKADQSITFDGINDQETTNRLGLTATATSGLEVSFSVLSGSATITDGTNLSFTGAGGVSLIASQSGNDNWNAAPDVTNTFNVTKALASVTLTNLTQTYDGTIRGVGFESVPSGLSVLLTYDGNMWAPTNAGSYAVTGTVDDVMYQGVATGTLVVAKADQTIHFAPISDQLTTNQVELAASADSGLAVTFTTNGGPAVIKDGTNLSFTGAGEVSIVASQLGDSNWNAAPDVTNTFNVTKAVAGVTLTNLTQTYDGTARGVGFESVPVGLSVLLTYDGNPWAPTNVGTYVVTGTVDNVLYQGEATGTLEVTQGAATVTLDDLEQTYDGTPRAVSATTIPSGLSVLFTYDGDTNAPVNAGTYAVTGAVNDVNWQGEAVGTLTVQPAAASVYLSGLLQTYDGTARNVTATTMPAGLTVEITYNGSGTAPTDAGTYAITGMVVEANYTGVVVDVLSVSKASQTVTFTAPVSPVAETGVWTVVAIASSGLQVTNFSVLSGPGEVVANQLTFTHAGYVTLSATQEGDDNWLSASATTELYVAGVPLWVSTPVTTGTCLQPYLYTLEATDADSPAIFYSAESLPDWLSLTTFTNRRIIRTLAGQGTAGYNGDDQPALDAQLKFPAGLFRDASGLYLADQYNHRVRRVDPFGMIETISGDGTAGTGGDGGAATNAQLMYPTAVTRDAAGNLYIADRDSHRVRKVDTNGLIGTFAGTGIAGNTGDGGLATDARLRFPSGVAVDSSGNVYIADRDNNRIRKVNTAGFITTFAGTGAAGNTGNGGAATNARLRNPVGLALDNAGRLYIADQNNHAIRRVEGGVITTVAGIGTGGFNGNEIAATNAMLNKPAGVAFGADGNLYIADTDNHQIRWVDDAGIIHSLAGMTNSGFSGDNGPATNAQLYTPFAVVVDDSGVVALSDYNNQRIRQIDLPTVGLTGTPPTGGVYEITLWVSDGIHSNAQNFQLVIDKALATVTLDDLEQTYDGTSQEASATTVPSGLSVLFTYDGGTNAPVNAGSYAVTGTVNDATYQGSAVGTLTVMKADQGISFGVISDQLTTNQVGLAATADSGLVVTFTTNGGPAVITDGTNLSFTGAGEVSIVASQSGDDNWNAAPEVTNTFNVTKALASVTLTNLTQTYDGTARSVGFESVPSGLSVLLTYDGNLWAPTNVGTYTVTGTVDDVMYQGVATGTLEVTKGTAGVYLGSLTQIYDGNAKSVTATTMPSGLTVEFTYDGNAWAPTNAGHYAVTGTVNDANWQGLAINSLEVGKGAAEVYLGDLTQVYDGSARSVTATTMPSGLTVEFTYDGNAWAPTNAGTYAVTGTVNDVNYQGVQTGALTVAKADQTITNFPFIGDQIVTNVVHLSGQASSGLPVIFAGFGPTSMSNGTNLSFTGTGEVTIVAAQWGNENWNAAPVTSQVFVVRAVTYTITPVAGANGSILPGTPVTLDAGQSASFVVSAATTNFYIASLTTNGVEVRGVAGLYAYTSWWNHVQADGAITAAFASVTSDTATNGVSVPWLRQYYTNEADLEALKRRAGEDTDDDGMLTWKEYWSRTDPTDSDKFLRLTTIQNASASAGSVVRWTSETGVVYRLTSSTNLLTDGFTTVVATNIPATPPINVITDEAARGKAGLYYRIGVER